MDEFQNKQKTLENESENRHIMITDYKNQVEEATKILDEKNK